MRKRGVIARIGKGLYSHLDYIFVAIITSLVFFTRIEPSRHYLKEHAKDVPWHEAVEIILATKNPRKKNGKFEIETSKYYVLFEVENGVLYVINAKQT